MTEKAVQDYYPDDMAICYGCGRLNEHGLQIKSYWQGDACICSFIPKPYHATMPGYVYGGLIASLIDCHATATAASDRYREQGKTLGNEPLERFVTASLHVDYLAPTPIEATLELRGQIQERKGRKMVVAVTLSAENKVRARGLVVTVQMPDNFLSKEK